jgi:succinate dehydrogenase / fumarate reductase flavoprotein subunit
MIITAIETVPLRMPFKPGTISASAIGRTENRGADAREDFPKRDDEEWLKCTLSWLDTDDRVRLDYRPVHLRPLSNEVMSIPPKQRVY